MMHRRKKRPASYLAGRFRISSHAYDSITANEAEKGCKTKEGGLQERRPARNVWRGVGLRTLSGAWSEDRRLTTTVFAHYCRAPDR